MDLDTLIIGNSKWEKIKKNDSPEYFEKLSSGQQPDILWIGCSDSRVDPQEITGQSLGSIFVQRNIANLVKKDDPNIQAVVNFAVTELKVKHIIICGHYHCGGVEGAVQGVGNELKSVSNWLAPVSLLYDSNKEALKQLTGKEKQLEKLVELNVIEQVNNMASLEPVIKRWEEGGELTIHGAVFELSEEGGKLVDLGVSINKQRPASK